MARPKGAKNIKKIDPVETPKLPEASVNTENDTIPVKLVPFRINEAATQLGVTEPTIRLWLAHGILKSEKYNGETRVLRESILNCRFRP